ncbi:amidinotransferase [Streptomyces thermolineatus]|uniref:Amidinotransferase n=1 Tax=Streptomyces thermolineatus TaxID=44033 RepID=A0ABP5ZHS0_9ACTN
MRASAAFTGTRTVTPRRYLMCAPIHFRVSYSINPWMDPERPVDPELALTQWEQLRALYLALGHTIELLPPVPGLPDMVFAANGATVVDGRVFGARFATAQREAEALAHLEWFRLNGFTDVCVPEHINEGEGDFAVTDSWVLAGRGFRTTHRSHAEAQEFFGRPVIGLDLVDPRYYHLDTALAVLDGDEIMYYPEAFSPGSRAVLARLFPDALQATAEDAAAFGLNAVCDGRNVFLPLAASGLFGPLRERGFEPVGVDLSELLKAGGSVKCCTMELRPPVPAASGPEERAGDAAASFPGTPAGAPVEVLTGTPAEVLAEASEAAAPEGAAATSGASAAADGDGAPGGTAPLAASDAG